MMRGSRTALLGFVAIFGTSACQELSSFNSRGDHFEGTVTQGSFVRTGFDNGVRMCLTLDTEKLQQEPGDLRTSDGAFKKGTLRAVPQTFHDPLSTFQFGQGREKNFMYFAQLADGTDALAVVSLMKGGNDVEVRVLRGAPGGNSGAPQLFGVFPLKREPGACSF